MVPAPARRWAWLAAAVAALAALGGCAAPSSEQPSGSAASAPHPCSSVADASNAGSHRLDVDGVERAYLLELPPLEHEDGPVPLIISLHGHGGSAAEFEATTGLARAAAASGFATATPDALGSPARWNFDRRPDGPDDGALVDALIDGLSADGCIDPHRVALVGSSNGAAFAGLASCTGDHAIRAVAMVIATVPTTGCADDRRPSVFTIRGTADTHVPFDGVDELVAEEAVRAGCGPVPRLERPAPGVERTGYRGCRGGGEVLLDAVIGGTHRWPAPEPGGATNAYRATDEILAFLAATT